MVQLGAVPPRAMLALGRSVVLEDVPEINEEQVMEESTSLTDKVTVSDVFSVIVCAEMAAKTGASFTAVIVTDAVALLDTTPLAVTV